MEFLVASAIGAMTAAGVYLALRGRTFPVVVWLTMLSSAINVFLVATGRLVLNRPPTISDDALRYPAPLPHALAPGRASCGESVCQYVSFSVFAVSLKKKIL